MTRQIFITPKANEDLDNYFAYIAENNPNAALRFFDAARQTFANLARIPGMGNPYSMRNLRLQGLRKRAIAGFENYLIFYHNDERIDILRVFHAARDIKSILERAIDEMED